MIVGIVRVDTGVVPLEEFRPAEDTSTAVTDFCSSNTPSLDPNDYLGVDGSGVDLSKSWAWDFGPGSLVEVLWRSASLEAIEAHCEERTAAISGVSEERALADSYVDAVNASTSEAEAEAAAAPYLALP